MLKIPRPSLVLLSILAALPGCGPTASRPPKTPHDGAIVAIPEGKGSVEIVKRAVEGRADQVRYVVYFYGPDDRPMATLPSAASFLPSGPGSKAIPLKDSGAADSSMISEPFPGNAEAEGKLMATIDGKPLAIPVLDR